jgi:hypothetical protein
MPRRCARQLRDTQALTCGPLTRHYNGTSSRTRRDRTPPAALTGSAQKPLTCGDIAKWSYGDSNPRPLACHADLIRRSPSDRVGRGATSQQVGPDTVQGRPPGPGCDGSQRWLPLARRPQALDGGLRRRAQPLSVVSGDAGGEDSTIWPADRQHYFTLTVKLGLVVQPLVG